MNCDITSTLLRINVDIETSLHLLSREQFHYKSANIEDGTCLNDF